MGDEFVSGTGAIEVVFTDRSRVTREAQAWCGHCEWKSVPRPDWTPEAQAAFHWRFNPSHRVYCETRRMEIFGFRYEPELELFPEEVKIGGKSRKTEGKCAP